MNGKSIMSRKINPQRLHHTISTPEPVKVDAEDRIDIGDWSLAQDENGSLIIHNVMTGKRVILSRSV